MSLYLFVIFVTTLASLVLWNKLCDTLRPESCFAWVSFKRG